MEDWYSKKSIPEILTEIIKSLGIKEVQVEEILSYDYLENPNNTIYGLIFCSQYIKNLSYIPNILSHWDKDLFFSKRIYENTSAIQSIISILFNNEDKINIGPNLKELKIYMNDLDPVTRGITLANNEKIKNEQDKFLNKDIIPKELIDNEGDDIYNFISFIHFKNAIYELDGLQEGPILIENNVEFKDWTKKIKNTIIQKINFLANNEMKFNLMVLIPDKLEELKTKKDLLISQKNFIEEKIKGNNIISKEFEELNGMNTEQLKEKLQKIEIEIEESNNGINIEKMKINKYKEENEKRQHNYTGFIFELIKMMGEKGIFQEVYKKSLNEQK